MGTFFVFTNVYGFILGGGGGVVYSSHEYNKKFEVSTKRNADH